VKKKKALWVVTAALLLAAVAALLLWLVPFGDKKDASAVPLYVLNFKDLPRATLTEGVTYVSEHCLYMSPLSSTLSLAGDSGYAYHWSAEGLTKTYLPSGGSTLLRARSDWEAFPWTDEEWNDMFTLGGMRDVSQYFEKMRVMSLGGGTYLMDMDGSLWYASISQHPDGTPYVWSIYVLIPAHEKGSTVIDLDEGAPLQIRVDVEYESVTVDVTGYRDTGDEEPAYVSDYQTLHAGELIQWSPYSEEGSMSRAVLCVHLKNGEQARTAVTLYLIKEETGRYCVIPVGTDRTLTVEDHVLVLR